MTSYLIFLFWANLELFDASILAKLKGFGNLKENSKIIHRISMISFWNMYHFRPVIVILIGYMAEIRQV